ncbi:MAG: hypothetical protein GY861_04095 [bacterium]|nr:hypothetical protein [bacterium]
METIMQLSKKVLFIRWTARILGTVIIAFSLLFFIGGVIENGGLPKTDFSHGVISILFILSLIGYLIAWRWEGIGGIGAAICFLLFYFINVFWVRGGKDPESTIILIIPAPLFIYCWWKTKNK